MLLVLLAGTFTARPAHPTWPHDPSANLPVCTATNSQGYPVIVSDGEGGTIVAWGDYRAGNNDIYVQRLDPDGVPLWTADGVALCTASYNQEYPVIVSDGAGGAIVAWEDYRSGWQYDIYVRRISSAGVPQWTADGVALCTNTQEQRNVVIASDGAGGAIVAWEDLRGSWQIYAQRVDSSGVVQWTADGEVVSAALDAQYVPAITADGAGGAIIAWADYRSGSDFDVYAQRMNASGAPQWTADGQWVCTATDDQSVPVLAPDNSGGAIIAWWDYRSGSYADVYAQRINSLGVNQWTSNGVAVCTAANEQRNVVIASDGSEGAVIAWNDSRVGANDIYAQRVNALGTTHWTSDGVALCTATGFQEYPDIASDGAGGAVVTWHDGRVGGYDIYAQRVTGSGAPLWTADGAGICVQVNTQANPKLVGDGEGGAVIVWQDARVGSFDIYAQKIERFGMLGDPGPVIVGVEDVPNDQGGQVKVSWNASYLDAVPSNPIDDYWIWREVPAGAALAELERGSARMLAAGVLPTGSGRALRTSAQGGQTYYWEYVDSQAAHAHPAYSYIASTASDSVAGSNPYTRFMVEAVQNSAGYFWGSAPDSGYSVDNLAPAPPAPFTGTYAGGSTALHWGENTEDDFAVYRLYRGSTSDFVPGPGNLVTGQPDTGYVDSGPAGSYYKLSAVDIHGNESGFALLTPEGTLDAPGARLPRDVWLARAAPNPMREAATLHFGLPVAARVSLAIYDQQGRLVRTVLAGVLPAGEQSVQWDGRDGTGQLAPSGLYFARLEVEGHSLTRRLAVLR
jgi:hypothetical protein